MSRQGLEKIKKIFAAEEHHVVILDEANVAVKVGLFSEQELLDLIALKPENTELLLTGRDASPGVIEKADLVTEMREIKHYFRKGIQARVGIEK